MTKYTARRIEPTRTDVARDRSRRTHARATRTAPRASRPLTFRSRDADDRAVLGRAMRLEPIARRRSGQSFFVLSRAKGRPALFTRPRGRRRPGERHRVRKRVFCFLFFGDSERRSRRDAPRAHRTSVPCRTIRAHADVRLSCRTAARTRRTQARRARSRLPAGSPRTRRDSRRTKSCRSPACRRR